MKKTTTAIFTGVALSFLATTPAFALNMGLGANATANVRVASSTVKVGAQTKLEARINTAKEHAAQEIDRRTTALSNLNTRVQAMVKLTSEEKANIEKFVQDQISALASLKTKIASDTDIETLKTDIKSITQSYRIFLLVMPQAHITLAADKIMTVASRLTELDGKLTGRIADAKSKGQNVLALESLEIDLKSKIDAATSQASAAASAAASLTPDGGDQSKAAANKAALQDARSKIKAALQAIGDARKDAGQIVAGLKGGASVNTAATTTVSH